MFVWWCFCFLLIGVANTHIHILLYPLVQAGRRRGQSHAHTNLGWESISTLDYPERFATMTPSNRAAAKHAMASPDASWARTSDSSEHDPFESGSLPGRPWRHQTHRATWIMRGIPNKHQVVWVKANAMERRVPCESQLSVFPGLDDNATTDKVTRPRTGTQIYIYIYIIIIIIKKNNK